MRNETSGCRGDADLLGKRWAFLELGGGTQAALGCSASDHLGDTASLMLAAFPLNGAMLGCPVSVCLSAELSHPISFISPHPPVQLTAWCLLLYSKG